MFERGGNTRTKPQEIKRDQPSDKTIIFCCPNAGYYEYMFCEVSVHNFPISNII